MIEKPGRDTIWKVGNKKLKRTGESMERVGAQSVKR